MLTKTSITNLFIAYSEKDVNTYKKFYHQLDDLKRDHKIKVSDMHATTTEQGRGVRLDDADMIVALITPNFMQSEPCKEVEAVAFHKHHTKGIPIVPILMEDTDISNSSLNELAVLPSNNRGIASWDNQQDGLNEIISKLKERIHNS